jgi:hypothetical protein
MNQDLNDWLWDRDITFDLLDWGVQETAKVGSVAMTISRHNKIHT